eukprot:344509-Rhodomonas_salina.1
MNQRLSSMVQVPCILRSCAGADSSSSVEQWMWCDGQLVGAHEAARITDSEGPQSPNPRDAVGNSSDPEDEYEEEEDPEDPEKNWRTPKSNHDFAALAGQAEMSALEQLGFKLRLRNGTKIGRSNGLDDSGMLTQDALTALQIRSYTELWKRTGRVVTKAIALLSAPQAHSLAQHRMCRVCQTSNRCSPSTLQKTYEQVKRARHDIETSIYYRQLDMLVFREKNGRHWNSRKFTECKQDLLSRSTRESILQEFHRDTEDRKRMREMQPLPALRVEKLARACPSHVLQLDMRLEACDELDKLLHRICLHNALTSLLERPDRAEGTHEPSREPCGQAEHRDELG